MEQEKTTLIASPTERARIGPRAGIAHGLSPIGRRLWQAIQPRMSAIAVNSSNRFLTADRAQFPREKAGAIHDTGEISTVYHAADCTVQRPLAMSPGTSPEAVAAGRQPARDAPSGRVTPHDGREDLLTLLRTQCRQSGQRPALIMEQEGLDLTITYADLWRRASRVAGALAERGLEPGDRIAILSESRPEWAICLLAGLLADAIVVPLDYVLEEGELLDIVDDSTPSMIFTSEKYQQTGQNLTQRAKSLTHQFLINGRPASQRIETIGDLEIATPVSARQPEADDTAMIVYTSGTMGRPKGVVTTFGALSFQLMALQDRFHLTAEDRFLSILPLNHLLELTVVLLCALNTGASVVYAHSLFPADILRMLRKSRITVIVGVPIVFRALRNSIIGHIANQPILVRILFRGAMAMAHYLPAWQLRRLLFFPLYRHFGRTLRFCASGGAYLEPSAIRFFELLGIPLLQGYGLTETGPVISVNGLRMNRAGSVGKPLPGVEVRIDRAADGGDGEILTRGPHVMAGYFKQAHLTKRVVNDAGWFRTGDIGELDTDGYLYVTGRRKNIIVLDSGKNVQPEEVEEVILNCPIVRECCVIGRPTRHGPFERIEEVCAVVVPTEAFIELHDSDHATVQDEIEAAVMKQVRVLAAFKRPVAVEVTLTELPKSPIKKIKRNDVREQFGGDRHHLEVE